MRHGEHQRRVNDLLEWIKRKALEFMSFESSYAEEKEGGRKEDPRGGNVVVEESEVEGTVQGTGLPLDGGVEEEDEEDMSDHLSHHSGRSTRSNRSASQKKGPIGGGGDSPSAGRKQRTGKSTQKHRKVIQSCLTLIKHLSQLSK